MAQLEARLDGIEEVVGSNPIGSTQTRFLKQARRAICPAAHEYMGLAISAAGGIM